jgi:hypothetical protein
MPECFDYILSLGGRCQVAHQLRRVFPVATQAFPFDWLITSDASLIRLLEADFADFLAPGDLVENATNRPEFSHRHVRETRYGTLLTHDIRQDVALATAWPELQAKYAFLIARWRSVLASGARVLFLRQSYGPTDAVKDDATDLADAALGARIAAAITAHYPRLEFELLCLPHRAPPETAVVSSVTLTPMPQRAPWVWTGDDAAWDALLAGYRLRPAAGDAAA